MGKLDDLKSELRAKLYAEADQKVESEINEVLASHISSAEQRVNDIQSNLDSAKAELDALKAEVPSTSEVTSDEEPQG